MRARDACAWALCLVSVPERLRVLAQSAFWKTAEALYIRYLVYFFTWNKNAFVLLGFAEHRVDAIGYCEDELEGALYDVRMEDDKLQYCHDRLRDAVKSNVKPIWELAKQCLELRTHRPPPEAVEDDVNYLLREEMKQTERTAMIMDNVTSRVEEQHR